MTSPGLIGVRQDLGGSVGGGGDYLLLFSLCEFVPEAGLFIRLGVVGARGRNSARVISPRHKVFLPQGH